MRRASLPLMTAVAAMLLGIIAGCSPSNSANEAADGTVVSIDGRPAYADLLTAGGVGALVQRPAAAVTVFAPSDDAIRAAKRDRPDLFAGADQQAFLAKLQAVSGRVDLDELAANGPTRLRTLAGVSFEVASIDGQATINGEVIGPVISDHGDVLIYQLDGILLPPG